MKQWLFLGCAVLLLGAGCVRSEAFSLPGGALHLERAQTPEEHSRGLSGRPCLASDEGMVFLFDHPAVRPFWMKDMRCSIDIVYTKEGVITEIFANVPFPSAVDGKPITVFPTQATDRVVEVKAGEADRRGWAIGTKLFEADDAR